MITSLHLLDFKNFESEALRVGPFTLIVGANASGKSNIRDAFRFLHGIGRGYTLAEIIGGKRLGGGLEWESIRGAPREIARVENGVFALGANVTVANVYLKYFVGAVPELLAGSGFRIGRERLSVGNSVIYRRSQQDFEGELSTVLQPIERAFRRDQPILTQIQKLTSNTTFQEHVSAVLDALANIRFLDLVPDQIRQPSIPGQTVLGDSGENLPTVLQALCADPTKKEVLAQWTRELTPMDVKDFDFREGPDGKVHLILQERSGKEISAQSASDGTLRFLAILAALLGPDPARLYFLEEIDNGIHPSRLNLLTDLIEQQTEKGEIQVVATTHSPQLLSMIGDTTFENTSVVCRLEDTEDAIIRRVADLPNAKELRESQGLGRLLAGGWMETALAFTDGDRNDGENTE